MKEPQSLRIRLTSVPEDIRDYLNSLPTGTKTATIIEALKEHRKRESIRKLRQLRREGK